MKKLLLPMIIGISAFIVVYLLSVLIAWEFNPGKWPEEGRFIFTLAATLISVFLAGAYYMTSED